MQRLRLIHAERGDCGVLRRYQHARHGILDIVTVWDGRAHGSGPGGADIVYIQSIAMVRRVIAAEAEQKKARRRKRARVRGAA